MLKKSVVKEEVKQYSRGHRYAKMLPSIKKTRNSDMVNLDEYMFNKPKSQIIDSQLGNRIFKHIENNSKVYEQEIVKYLGFELEQDNIKSDVNKKYISKSTLEIIDENKDASLWEKKLKKIDQQEQLIMKSLEQLDKLRKTPLPKQLKPLQSNKKQLTNTKSSVLIKPPKKLS